MNLTTDHRTLALIKQRLDEAERNIQYVLQALKETPGSDDNQSLNEQTTDNSVTTDEKILEGVFDGQNMQGSDGQEYPVPPNYASKSKLVEGDILKLTIGPDGSFVYKQIKPVERKRVVGHLTIDEHGSFRVQADTGSYRVLLASVTFYKAEEGDEITILLPQNGDAQWGAVENVMHQ